MLQRGGGLLLRAVELTLDGRKLGFALVGFLVVTVPTAFFLYLASVTGFGGAVLFSLLAGVVMWMGLSSVFGALARMMVMELRTGQAVSWRQAIDYVRQHLITFLLSPLVLFLGFLGVILGEMVVLFLGRIPYLGESWRSPSSPRPLPSTSFCSWWSSLVPGCSSPSLPTKEAGSSPLCLGWWG